MVLRIAACRMPSNASTVVMSFEIVGARVSCGSTSFVGVSGEAVPAPAPAAAPLFAFIRADPWPRSRYDGVGTLPAGGVVGRRSYTRSHFSSDVSRESTSLSEDTCALR